MCFPKNINNFTEKYSVCNTTGSIYVKSELKIYIYNMAYKYYAKAELFC